MTEWLGANSPVGYLNVWFPARWAQLVFKELQKQRQEQQLIDWQQDWLTDPRQEAYQIPAKKTWHAFSTGCLGSSRALGHLQWQAQRWLDWMSFFVKPCNNSPLTSHSWPKWCAIVGRNDALFMLHPILLQIGAVQAKTFNLHRKFNRARHMWVCQQSLLCGFFEAHDCFLWTQGCFPKNHKYGNHQDNEECDEDQTIMTGRTIQRLWNVFAHATNDDLGSMRLGLAGAQSNTRPSPAGDTQTRRAGRTFQGLSFVQHQTVAETMRILIHHASHRANFHLLVWCQIFFLAILQKIILWKVANCIVAFKSAQQLSSSLHFFRKFGSLNFAHQISEQYKIRQISNFNSNKF